MYTLDSLLEDVTEKRGSLAKQGDGSYAQVWEAFNRYVTDVMEKRKTLNVQNFCMVGWKFDEGMHHGRARIRPYFQLADSFVRAHGVDARALPATTGKLLAPIEDFNYSKAAIRYSQNLTKDNIFMGLRAIIQGLGEAASAGKLVSLDLEVGRLLCEERKMRFAFAACLYLREGLEVPAGAAEDVSYKPSVSFARPSQDSLTLSLRGSSVEAVAARARALSGAIQATDHGGWSEVGLQPPAAPVPFTDALDSETSSWCERDMDRQIPEALRSPGKSQPTRTRQDHVHNEAMNRAIEKTYGQAVQVIEDSDMWEMHLQRCTEEEEKERQWRKALYQDYGDTLKRQIQQQGERRLQDKRYIIDQASPGNALRIFDNVPHTLPELTAAQESLLREREKAMPQQTDLYDCIRRRKDNLKQDLDQQVDTKYRLKVAIKQQERELEASQITASLDESLRAREQANKKGQVQRATLQEAWDKDMKLHALKRAISNYDKAPAAREELCSLVASSLAPPRCATTESVASFAPSTQLGQGPAVFSKMSPRQEAHSLSPRMLTGSRRRQPIGAAASLALQKERLGAALRISEP